MSPEERIAKLESFKSTLIKYKELWRQAEKRAPLRTVLNQDKMWVRQEVIAARCFKTVTVAPPAAIGGLVLRDGDPFDMMFDGPYGSDMSSVISDMIEETIGVIRHPPAPSRNESSRMKVSVKEGYAFVAMPMTGARGDLDDVLDAIKEAAHRCGVQAERIDEPASTDRITDRIIESIQRAQFVIADLTDARPNVYYEAGYAHGIGKVPIYIAREGTRLEFDLKDYPVIFFDSFRQLKDDLEKRLRALG
jgi:hypothetical protein